MSYNELVYNNKNNLNTSIGVNVSNIIMKKRIKSKNMCIWWFNLYIIPIQTRKIKARQLPLGGWVIINVEENSGML